MCVCVCVGDRDNKRNKPNISIMNYAANIVADVAGLEQIRQKWEPDNSVSMVWFPFVDLAQGTPFYILPLHIKMKIFFNQWKPTIPKKTRKLIP